MDVRAPPPPSLAARAGAGTAVTIRRLADPLPPALRVRTRGRENATGAWRSAAYPYGSQAGRVARNATAAVARSLSAATSTAPPLLLDTPVRRPACMVDADTGEAPCCDRAQTHQNAAWKD
eukprot:365157-Chlamydomonas_euryale.AAC.10